MKILASLTLISLISVLSGRAQTAVNISMRIPYYLDITSISSETVNDISEGKMDIQYQDNIGRSKQVHLEVFDWKLEKIGTFKLDKTSGLNHYTVSFDEQGVKWKPGDVFNCQMIDEVGTKYKWTVRAIGKPVVEGPQADIFVNPKNLICDGEDSESVIEFISDINSGRTPYTITWYVMNQARSGLLYQPKEEIIDSPNKASMIVVQKQPAYYVVLQVTDSCGNTDAKVVYVACEGDKKKINTIFVGPLSKWKDYKDLNKIK